MCLHIHAGVTDPGGKLREFVTDNDIRTLNIAGQRASGEPEVAEFVKEVLGLVCPE